MTTATTITAADPLAQFWAENARLFELRHAMCAWRMDGGRARLYKDVAREQGASEREIARAYRRVSADISHGARDYRDLDAYIAAWRDALVKALRAHRAMVNYYLGEALERFVKEARCYRLMNGAKTHHRVRAHRMWRRNAERMVRKWQRAH
jgi:AAA+ ATPase superfamily predicted ATPase